MNMTTTKSKFENLVNAIKAGAGEDANDYLDILEKDMYSLGEYVDSVTKMETSIVIARARLEGEALRDRVMQLDKNRRDCHELAIMGIKRMNRFAKNFEVEPIYAGDVDDRYAIADFCMKTVEELFSNRNGQYVRERVRDFVRRDDDFER